MKKLYLIITMAICSLNGFSTYVLPPNATISGTTTVSQNATSPLITFVGSGGTALYTYTINGVAQTPI